MLSEGYITTFYQKQKGLHAELIKGRTYQINKERNNTFNLGRYHSLSLSCYLTGVILSLLLLAGLVTKC